MMFPNKKYYTIKKTKFSYYIQAVKPSTHIVSRNTLLNLKELINEFEQDGYIYITPVEFEEAYIYFMNYYN